MQRLIDDLISAVGGDHVIVDADRRRSFEVDWTGRYAGAAAAVVRPSSTAEVAAVVRCCGEHGASIVAQGGNTGLVGGGVPNSAGRPSVIVTTSRLDRVGDVDPDAMQVTTGAGVTISRWRDTARAVGLDTPIDFAARESATVGGAISTNAGGSRVVRFGTMRRQVVGVEMVLADGSVVGSLNGLPKETAGLHWPSLACGAEGTLGVVTTARLRVVPWFRAATTAMVATDSTASAVALLRRLRSDLDSLDAVEMIRPDALQLVADHVGRPSPVEVADGGMILVVECAAHQDPTEALGAVIDGAEGVDDTAIAADPTRREQLLAYRDRLTESIAQASTEIGVPVFKLDVAVPVDRLDDLIALAESTARADGCRLVAFGHLAEGNVHLNHIGANDPDTIADTVLPAVASMGGTISAEHGIGIAKAAWLPTIRSRPDLAAQIALTRALDPDRLFNPGVLGR